MRHIEVEEGLRLRFPGRDEEFDQGVEIGLVLARLSSGEPEFIRSVTPASVDQARELARGLGYHVRVLNSGEASCDLCFSRRRRRPHLTLVSNTLKSA